MGDKEDSGDVRVPGLCAEGRVLLKMVCVEKDPLRTYIADQDPVYQDSAMEAFLQFESAGKERTLPFT